MMRQVLELMFCLSQSTASLTALYSTSATDVPQTYDKCSKLRRIEQEPSPPVATRSTSMHTDRVSSFATADDRELRTRFVRFRINDSSYL